MDKVFLSGCVMSVVLATVAARADGTAVRHWAVEPMSDIMRLPDKVPTDGVETGVVRIVMAKDEYEPGSFVVQAAKDLGKVRFELAEFKQVKGKGEGEERTTDVVFPKENLDLKFIKVWGQNRNGWYGYFGDNGRKLCPELLVNDEDLIRTDPKTCFNYAKLVESDGRVHEQWIDPPYQFDHENNFRPMRPNFRDAKTHQPVALPQGECKQFFLTVRTTKDTPEGLYRGEVQVKVKSEGEAVLARIPVEICVLPFALPRPKSYTKPYDDMMISCYQPASWRSIRRANGGDHQLMLKQIEALYANAVRHGMNMTMFSGNVAETNDMASVREAMMTVAMMNRVGMRTDVLQGGAFPYKLHWWGRKSPITYEEARSNAEYVVKCADAAFGHHNIYMGYGDEPAGEWLIANRGVFMAFEDVGMKFFLAGWGAIFQHNPFAMDWQNIGGSPEGGVELVNKWNQLGMKTAWYAGHHVGPENPAFNRRQYGFNTYFGGYTAICNYEHGFAHYNDNRPKYRRMNNVYGTADGVLDTLQWEGFREGIDDIRYATALRELAQRALRSDDGEVRRTGRKALAMFANYRMESEDLSRFRSRIVDYILALRGAVGDPSPDKPFAQAKVAPIPEGGNGDEPPKERWRWVKMYCDNGEYDKACDEYLLFATNNPAQAFHARGGMIDPVGIEAAYLAGRIDLMKAISFDLLGRDEKSTNRIYETRFIIGALLAEGGDSALRREWSRLDDLYRIGVDDATRLKVIDRVGQIFARKFGPDRVMTYWNWRENRLKASPRKHYTVAWSDRRVYGPEAWESVKPEESVFDRKWKGDFSFLTTDVSTGNRGVGAAGVAGGATDAVSMSVIADEWGLHFRFTDRTDEAKAIGIGAKGDGSYECYIAPGLQAPYSCVLADVSRNGGLSTWNTTYNSPGWRRLDAKSQKQVKSYNICRDDRVETYVSLAWTTYFNRIPDGKEPWEFETLRWGKHNSAWNGTHYVHGRSTWGFLDIPLKPQQRAAIYRALLLEAKNDFIIGDTADYWKDPELGDPAFYAAVVRPELEKVETWKKRIVPEMDDKTALELGQSALPAMRDFGFTIDCLRTRYTAEQRCK